MLKSSFPGTGLCLLVLLSLVFPPGEILGQTTLGMVEGRIMDEEGMTLPGVSVTMKNQDTGYTYTAVSSVEGIYIIKGIQPGDYVCEVLLPGFAPQKRTELVLNIGSRLKIDFQMKPAALSEEVIVTAGAPMIEVTKSEVSSIVDREKIDSLPLLNRNFNDLSMTKAGVQEGRSNAQPLGSEEMLIDGVRNEETMLNQPRAMIPADAIQEFRVMTNQFEAEYGNTSGMIRNAVTRSGTNEWKGRLSFFMRDEAFDSVNYFVNHAEYGGPELPKEQWDKSEFRHLRFGGFLGGPIIKDKAHFFLAYEGLRHTDYATITSPLVERETIGLTEHNNQVFLKFNYQPNNHNSFFLRYSYDHPSWTNMDVGGLMAKERGLDRSLKSHDFQFNWTFFLSSGALNELRFFYADYGERMNPVTTSGTSVARPSGTLGPSVISLMESEQPHFQVLDNFSLFLGDHQIKLGFDFFHSPARMENKWLDRGEFTFLTDQPFDPNNFSTYPFLYFYNASSPSYELKYSTVALFAQDSWRIHSRLTLNVGMRYSYFDAPGLNLVKWDLHNLNPRFGFSWDLLGDGRTAIRGGIGTYSSNPAADAGAMPLVLPQWDLRIIYYPNYPDPFQPNPFLPSMQIPISYGEWGAKENQVAPYSLQATLGIQRECLKDLSVGADLIWTKGYRLLRLDNLNPVIPGTTFMHEDPTRGDVRHVTDNGRSDYKALYFTISKRYSHGWSLDLAYTLSRSWSDVETEESEVQNYEPDGWERQYGPTLRDARHRVSLTGIVDLPLGFQLSGILYYRSAMPWNAVYASDKNADSLVSDYVDYRKNSRRGYDLFYLNSRLSKSIRLNPVDLQLFVEVYNLTNRSNYSSVFNVIDTPNFGKPMKAGDPRLLQMGLRIDF